MENDSDKVVTPPDSLQEVGMPRELLPCPFCGSAAYIVEESAPKFLRVLLRLPRLFEVHCGLHQCPAMMQTGRYETEELATRCWNTRAGTQRHRAGQRRREPQMTMDNTENSQPPATPPFAALAGSAAYDSFKSAIESGDIEHLLWWASTARALIAEVVQQHADQDSPEYNECDTSRCMWCENAAKLMPPNE